MNQSISLFEPDNISAYTFNGGVASHNQTDHKALTIAKNKKSILPSLSTEVQSMLCYSVISYTWDLQLTTKLGKPAVNLQPASSLPPSPLLHLSIQPTYSVL